MYINSYFYAHGSITHRLLDDECYMTDAYSKMFKSELSSIELQGRTALLYSIGVSVSQSEVRNSDNAQKEGIIVKELTAYSAHKYAKILHKKNDIVYMNLNSNTCASSMHSIYEAERLLNLNEVDNVIIIAEERTTDKTKNVFKESNIELELGEGFACVVLSNNPIGTKVSDTKWVTHYDNNPFKVTAEGYSKIFTECDMVKVHGTGTDVNDSAESKVFGAYPIIRYKDKIGHTQGASALIEICKVLNDDNAKGRVLCVASGLGSFYGSCLVWKI